MSWLFEEMGSSGSLKEIRDSEEKKGLILQSVLYWNYLYQKTWFLQSVLYPENYVTAPELSRGSYTKCTVPELSRVFYTKCTVPELSRGFYTKCTVPELSIGSYKAYCAGTIM